MAVKLKIVIAFDQNKSSRRKAVDMLASQLIRQAEVKLIDMRNKRPLHEIFYEIRDYDCDLLVSFDGAGTELRTELGGKSFNVLPCRIAYLMFDKLYKYDSFVEEPFNLSHYVFVCPGDNIEDYKNKYKNIPNLGIMSSFDSESAINEWLKRVFMEMEL